MLGTLPNGSRGFDCNTPVGPAMAKAFHDGGYRFVVRYVRRTTSHSYDLTVKEIVELVRAGLGVGVVQHVAPPGWAPSAALGSAYGRTAAGETHLLGLPPGITVWCDLEEVDRSVPASEVVAFCNAWHDAVKHAGYEPGLYVGYRSGLTPDELYYRLKFQRYWGAYNLDDDEVPAVRGLCMKQRAVRPVDRVQGCPFQYDVNVAMADRLGGTPTFFLHGDR